MMIIDTSSYSHSKQKIQKLSEDDEKTVKTTIKIIDDSDALLKVFKILNLFYSKFKEMKA